MRCAVALGSNLGDRLAHLQAGFAAVGALNEGPAAPLISAIYETEPVDCDPGTAAYLNAVIEIESSLEPLALLAALQTIEHAQGRPADHGYHAPRTLDLDLLYAGERVLQSAALTLPHPRIAQRRFVLRPLSDLHPGLILPGTRKTVAELLTGVPHHPLVEPFVS
ncbi:MAG: 2-amino-4-hydroxy-6-hydroxymethyldihydropteridine diphosphokinase [Chthoniobacteraceae bacterium]